MANFNLYTPQLHANEGGFVNHPDDPGGATNKGITLNTFRKYYNDESLGIENLKDLTTEEANEIYKEFYWDKIRGDDFDSQKLAEIVFDFAVNSGVSRAGKMLQYLLRRDYVADTIIDGIIGPQTISATNIASKKTDRLYGSFIKMREDYYNFLAGRKLVISDGVQRFFGEVLSIGSKSSNLSFIDGWLNRLDYFKKKRL